MKISELVNQKIKGILFKIPKFLVLKKEFFKTVGLVLVILVVIIFIFAIFQPRPAKQPSLDKLPAEEIFELRQKSQYQEVGAGITSSYFTYFLFPLDVAGEWAKLNILTWRAEKKALQAMVFIQEKTEELESLATGRTNASWHFNQTLRLHQYYEKKLQIALQEMQAKNDPRLLIVAGRINESLSRQAEFLENKIQEISDEKKQSALQRVAAQLTQSKAVAGDVIQEDFFQQDSIERDRAQAPEPFPSPEVPQQAITPTQESADGLETNEISPLSNNPTIENLTPKNPPSENSSE